MPVAAFTVLSAFSASDKILPALPQEKRKKVVSKKAENLKVLLPPFPPLPKPFIGTHALSRFLELLVVLMLLELLYLQGFRFQIQNK